MKRVLLVMVAALMISSVAMADFIGVYSDANGTTCDLTGAGQFTASATVIYKGFTPGGSTGARFKVVGPAGSWIFGFATPYVTIGTISNDLSIAFGTCIEGVFPLGTMQAIWASGTGGEVLPSDGYPNIIMTDCQFGEYPAGGGTFCVEQGACNCAWCLWCPPVGTQQSTWGQVKALYR
ncbi:MAG TPA: hypothetical protein VF247_00015 [Candidatus Krumholzibacteria bacterium]